MEMIFISSFISLTIIVFILLNNHFPRIDDQLDNFSEYRVIFVNFWIRSIPFKRNLFRFLILYFFFNNSIFILLFTSKDFDIKRNSRNANFFQKYSNYRSIPFFKF